MSDDNRLSAVLASDDAEGSTKKSPQGARFWVGLGTLGLLGLALLLVLGVAGYYGKSILDALNSVERDEGMMPTTSSRPSAAPTAEDTKHAPVNILILGSDSRGSDQGRSDVMIVAHLNGARDRVYLVSFPRDYWVPIPGHGTAKLNAAYAWGGPALTVETLEGLTGIRIEHSILIDFEGFKHVINAVGGITVNNRHESYNGEQHFPEGEISLNGDTALLYVRNRYGLPKGDFDRAERQRSVIMAVLDKLTSRGVLANPVKFREAVTALGPSFKTDTELTNSRIIELGLSMRLRGSQDMSSLLAPVAGFGTASDGQSYVEVNQSQLLELSEALRTDQVAEYVAKYPS